MVGKNFILAASSTLFIATSGAVVADPDRLPAPRMTAIQVAFDRALADPAMEVDRLSPAITSSMKVAYETHKPATSVDALPHSAWVKVQDSYRSHDPERTILAGVTTY